MKATRMKLIEIGQIVAFPRDQAPPLETVKSLNALTADLLKEISRKATK